MALFEALAELVGAALVTTAPGSDRVEAGQLAQRAQELPDWLRSKGAALTLGTVVDGLAHDLATAAETRNLPPQVLARYVSSLARQLPRGLPDASLLSLVADRARTGTGEAMVAGETLADRIVADVVVKLLAVDALADAELPETIASLLLQRVYGRVIGDGAVLESLSGRLQAFAIEADAKSPQAEIPGALGASLLATRALDAAGGTGFLADLRDRFGLSERALGRLVRLADRREQPADQFLATLERLAAWLGDAKAQLVKPSNDDAELRRLKSRAAAALADGDLEAAAEALNQVRREIRLGRRRSEERLAEEVAGLRAQMKEEARAAARLAELHLAGRDYAAAAELFSEAALALPAAERELAWRFDLQRAEALMRKAETSTAETVALTEAVSGYALCVRTASEASDQKGLAEASLGLGTALALAGERDQGIARLKDAVSPLRKAAGILEREGNTASHATAALRLALVLASISEREASSASLRDAVEALRGAVKLAEARRQTTDFVRASMSLGNALLSTEEAGGGAELLGEAAEAYAAALVHLDRDADPAAWADAQMNFGVALLGVSEQNKGADRLDEAIAALERAGEVLSRELAPQRFALIQLNLGNAHAALGARDLGDSAHLEQSITRYSAAVDGFSREHEPMKWAIAQLNLGTAHIRLGERREKRRNWLAAAAAMVPALEVFEAQGAAQYAEVTRRGLKRFHESWDQLLTQPSPEKAQAQAPRISKAG